MLRRHILRDILHKYPQKSARVVIPRGILTSVKFTHANSDVSLVHRAGSALARWFPVPKLLSPRAAGIDISDSSIKWLSLRREGESYRVEACGEMPLEKGIVESGIIRDVPALSKALIEVKHALGGISCAHAALPEEPAYVFGMHVPPETARDQTLRMIQFEFEGRVPIPPSAAVYDYTDIPAADAGGEIGVVVFPREIAEAYVEAFESAGITLLSLEVEARSIARAISDHVAGEPITLVADIGRARTGFAVLKCGVPIFTSTVDVGGDHMADGLTGLGMSLEEAERFKNDYGLVASGDARSKHLAVVTGTASALADEVTRHYHYWDTRRNEQGERVTPVGRVVLVGGNANLRGLPDFIAGKVQANTLRGNVWRHIASFEEYIPPIEKHESLQFATAIGLALRTF